MMNWPNGNSGGSSDSKVLTSPSSSSSSTTSSLSVSSSSSSSSASSTSASGLSLISTSNLPATNQWQLSTSQKNKIDEECNPSYLSS
jgi:hypothetical protein